MHGPNAKGLPPGRRPDSGSSQRLLPIPVDGEFGYWPYVNLIYLTFAYLPLFFGPPSDGFALGATMAATLLFLPLYFAGYVVEGWRMRAVLAGIALIGFVLIPLNPGGNTFLIYAIALAANALSTRAAVMVMLALLAIMAAEVGWFGQPWPFLALTAMIGTVVAVGSLYGRMEARRNAALRLSQEEVRRLARTAERERIGRDLHDLLGHTLSLIAMKSELSLKLFERDPARARVQMAEVERITRDALAQVRRAVSGIRAAGVEAELANARLSLLSAGVRLDYRLAPLPLPVETETVLALAVREAVTNVVRHAGASRVDVELQADGPWARLSVVDDGRGGALVPGNGLCGMRERVEALGGALELSAAPGEGTRVVLRVPRPPDAAPDSLAAPQPA